MELRVTRLSREELDQLDAQAAERSMSRSAYVRWRLLSGDVQPVNEAELDLLLAAKARQGHMRAIELLLRRTQPAEPFAPTVKETPAHPFSEVIELADRRPKP